MKRRKDVRRKFRLRDEDKRGASSQFTYASAARGVLTAEHVVAMDGEEDIKEHPKFGFRMNDDLVSNESCSAKVTCASACLMGPEADDRLTASIVSFNT